MCGDEGHTAIVWALTRGPRNACVSSAIHLADCKKIGCTALKTFSLEQIFAQERGVDFAGLWISASRPGLLGRDAQKAGLATPTRERGRAGPERLRGVRGVLRLEERAGGGAERLARSWRPGAPPRFCAQEGKRTLQKMP